MGKSVTIINGFTDVMLPSATGTHPYSSGQTAILTDAEYAALPTSTSRALTGVSTVADPQRPATDPRALAVTVTAAVTGSYTAKVGVNVITLTGNVTTFVFPTTPVGSASVVDLVIIQDATGSRLITWTASGAKFAGGTATVLTTTAAGVDRLRFLSRGDGATWDLIDVQKALA